MDWLIEYQRRLAEQVGPWGRQALLIFRGQSDESWKLDSSADRRLEKEAQPLSLIKYLTKVLIEPARSEGYAHQQNKKLNDLELLAKLQHYGAATCLIDFTANFNIALWFACADDTTDGKIFVVNRGDTQNFKEVTPERAEEGISKLLQPQMITQQSLSEITLERAREGITELLQPHSTTQRFVSSGSKPEIYFWKPPANENRIVVQHSCFIFSAQPIKPGTYKEIAISKEHKQEIRTLLQKYYGIDNQSIFRDFGGFAASQGPKRPITPIDPTSEELSLGRGNRHLQQGKYDKAIEDYNETIRINPQCGEAYTNRGTVKVFLGRHDDAIADYDQAIRINPESAQTYTNRGIVKAELNRHEEAIADYNQAIDINPQYPLAYYNRGNAKKALGQHDQAIADYDQTIGINPQDAEAHNNRGSAKGTLGRYEEAIADFSQAIHINPQSAEAYYNRGNAKAELNRHEEAIADFNQAIRTNPQFAAAYYNRGNAKDALRKHEEAIADFNEAIRINSQYAQAYCNRGTAKLALGQHDDAIADYDQAIRINPQSAEAYNNRGNAHKEIGEYEKARSNLQRALELATEQGNQEVSQVARSLLDQLPPADGGARTEGDVQ